MKPEAFFSSLLLLGMSVSLAVADENNVEQPSKQPYIDEIRKSLPPRESPATEGASEQPYIDSIKKSLPQSQEPQAGEQSYIDQLKKQNPEKFQKQPEGPSYTEEQRAKLPAKESGGAIQAVYDGRSELKPRFRDEVSNALGIRYGLSLSRDFTAAAGMMLRSFNDVYGENYAPDLTFFYEYQLIHHDGGGALGLQGSLGVAYFHGMGTFKFDLTKPWAPGQTFGLGTETLFQFFMVPVSVTAIYRMNLLKYVQPFAAAGPTLTGYYESRTDGVSGSKGASPGLLLNAGVAFNLDWVSSQGLWESYKDFGFRHSYLTVEFTKLSTFASDVNFSSSGILAGFTFEY